MGVRWNTNGIQLSCFAVLILILEIQGCWSLNPEGLALLEFRARVDYDPYSAFSNWNPDDDDSCMWFGVHYVDGEVQYLDLNGLSLAGELSPDLGKLSHLRSLVLYNNHFFGTIPKEIKGLTKLEVLDLRNNKLTGTIPAEIGGLQSLKRLLLCNNNFEGEIPLELVKLNLLTELQFDENLTPATPAGIGCVNRKFGHCIWQSSLKQLKKVDSFIIPIKGRLKHYLNVLPLFKSGDDSLQNPAYNCCDNQPDTHEMHTVQNIQNLVNTVRRRLLEQSSNLVAAPAVGGFPSAETIALPSSHSSGSFPAVPNAKKGQLLPPVPSPTDPSTQQNHDASNPDSHQSSGSTVKPAEQPPSSGGISGDTWKYLVLISGIAFLLTVAAVMFFMCRSRAVATIGPWKTGLSGQLQKAFVTGVPKLNRAELETACEDFSNIIDTVDGCTVYKGTLSSGVEIAVVACNICCQRLVKALSTGLPEKVKEMEHLDWHARTRIIMGTAYCLQYMHDLNPPVPHSNVNSNAIFLTDDYAAKIAEIGFWAEASSKHKNSGEGESEHSELPPISDPETNVYGFGVLLLELISGKLPYSDEQGPLVNWAAEYLNDRQKFGNMIDPMLKSFKNNELDIICEVIQDCIQPDMRKRPTMKEVTSKLREVISISPDAATPRLSPLWWAELEILSAEAA
ncbi:Protein MALE DISCOVERER 1 [Camellia lanceoleosa]|uniref:Protein MALE DISCOVERER 1 n=1 Tax=Camellia lanceoleosa TaxID=1840588 RepID=A0ACC0GPP8_9ERIC|nr:Protein MALE DISCOVERER 1 [Camellia lanceoleosa]